MKIVKNLISVFLIGSLIFPAPVLAAQKAKRGYGVSARAVIFSNSTRGQRYYGKNVDLKVPPASTTKVMTALMVLEKLPLDKIVTVSRRATYVQPSKIDVRPEERYRVADLLYALLMSSANDASIVLAEAVAGSEENFVRMMNDRARQLGAKHTRFVNSNGLPLKRARQYTTPYDMYLIFRAALKHEFFTKAIHYPYKTISSVDGRTIQLKSHNKLLFKNWQKKVYGKTGYTRAAKSCFVGYVMKGNDICIIAVYGCTRRWTDIKYIISRYGGIGL